MFTTIKKNLPVVMLCLWMLIPWISWAYSSEYQDAYNYAYAMWITTQNSIYNANMEWNLTRIAMAKMVANFALHDLWLKEDTSLNCNFSDVSQSLDAQYNYWVSEACRLWLMWLDNGKVSANFNPYGTVTRGQLATVLSRALSKANNETVTEWTPYYVPHLQYLYKKWIIKNTSSPQYYEVEKRWNLMLMMSRASKSRWSTQQTNTQKVENTTTNQSTNYDNILEVIKVKKAESNTLYIQIKNKLDKKVQIKGIHLSNVKIDGSINVYASDNTMEAEYLKRNSNNTMDVNFWYPIELRKLETTTITITAGIKNTAAKIDSISFWTEGDNYKTTLTFSEETSKNTKWTDFTVTNDGTLLDDWINRTYYDNWVLHEYATYKNGQLNWEYIEYYEDGSIKAKWTYKNWKADGHWNRYCHSSDKNCISTEWDYKEGNKLTWLEAYWTFNSVWYYGNWQIQNGEFRDDNWVLNWDYISFYSNWQIKEKWTYKDNEKSGYWITYYENGEVESKWSYKNWKLDWYWIRYCESTNKNCTSLDWNYKDWEKIWN